MQGGYLPLEGNQVSIPALSNHVVQDMYKRCTRTYDGRDAVALAPMWLGAGSLRQKGLDLGDAHPNLPTIAFNIDVSTLSYWSVVTRC